jgi:ribosomal protein S18 acetylase RimI-like enzyme
MRMIVSLRPMTAEDFDIWFTHSLNSQAEDRAWASGRSVADERADLEGLIPQLLPCGRATAGHDFYVAQNASGDPVGFLWLGVLPGRPLSEKFLFDIRVRPEHRRRGYGRRMLTLAMERAHRKGATAITLNVRSDNAPALALYRQLGFHSPVTAAKTRWIEMTRHL